MTTASTLRQHPAPAPVELRGLTLDVGGGSTRRRLLDDVHHAFPSGAVSCILGVSGAGKTSLLKVIAGLAQRTAGAVLVDGSDVTEYTAKQRLRLRRTSVAMVYQQYNLIETLTALENVSLAPELAGDRRPVAKQKARVALAELGLADAHHRLPATLSGGEQQRVALCRAMAGPHSVVLADEPTGALDDANGEIVVQALRELAKRGKCCIVVTHNQTVARAADHVATLTNGKLV